MHDDVETQWDNRSLGSANSELDSNSGRKMSWNTVVEEQREQKRWWGVRTDKDKQKDMAAYHSSLETVGLQRPPHPGPCDHVAFFVALS